MMSPSYIASRLIAVTAGARPAVLRRRSQRRHVATVAVGLLALLVVLLVGGVP